MRSGRVVSAIGAVAALFLLYVPFRAAAQAATEIQSLTLYTAVCALAGCVAVLALYERRPPAPAGLIAIGTLLGALFALVLVSRGPIELAPALRARVVVITPMYAVGVWWLVVAVRRLVPAERRPAALAALALAAMTLFGPALVAATSPEVHNLSSVSMKPVVQYWTVGAALLVLPLLALTTLPGDWFERWWSVAASKVMAPSNKAFAIGLVIFTVLLAAGFSWYCFGGGPITSDEIAQLWHARMLIAGHLALPPDPNPEFFAIDNIIDRPLWMSQFPIGGPAVQALGVAAGVAWLTNPVFTGLTAFSVYRFTQRVYGEPQGRAAAMVFVASPMVLIMGGSHMNHMPTAWLATLALAALPVWIQSADAGARRRAAMVIGASIGAAATIRPLDAAIVALLVGSVMLVLTARDRSRATTLPPAIAAGTVPVLLLLWANWRTTGAPLQFGYTLLWGPNHSLGLHDDPTGLAHTAWRALLLAVRYVNETNGFATTWPLPVLLFVALGVALTPRLRRWDALLLAYCALQLFAYAFYWHDGQFAGARFLFTAAPALMILAARAPFMLAERSLGAWRRSVLLLIPACIGAAWVRPMPPFGVQGMAMEYRAARASLKRGAPPDSVVERLPRSLVFVQEHASARLLRRLWALGVSRPDAVRLMRDNDACGLLDAARAEERRGAVDSAGRVERIALFARSSVRSVQAASTDSTAVADRARLLGGCAAELAHDTRLGDFMSYGPLLLRNRFDAQGRIDGQVVYVMDLSDRNTLLRSRFGDREWYRWEIPRGSTDSVPKLVPYTSTR